MHSDMTRNEGRESYKINNDKEVAGYLGNYRTIKNVTAVEYCGTVSRT